MLLWYKKFLIFLPSRSIKIDNIAKITNLQLADPYFFKTGSVDMIIGSDYLPLINLDNIKHFPDNSLEARQSQFGWYLSGPAANNEVKIFTSVVSNSADAILHEQIKKLWELEEVENTNFVSESDEYCEQFYKKTVQRQPDGRYVVRLPFKETFPDEIFLGPSKNIALSQYHRMEKILEKRQNLRYNTIKFFKNILIWVKWN